MKIVHYPHLSLRHPAKPLTSIDKELRIQVGTMFDLMYEHEGVGLAANQVDLPYRVFVANPAHSCILAPCSSGNSSALPSPPSRVALCRRRMPHAICRFVAACVLRGCEVKLLADA